MPKRNGRLPGALVFAVAGLTLAQFAALHAQRGDLSLQNPESVSIYGGSGPGWWTAGLDDILPREDEYNDDTGQLRVLNATGFIRSRNHPFFQALGTNGRACVTCHQPSNGMSVSAAGLRQRWEETEGKDPVYAAVDGANCPDLPQDEKQSHSLLLNRGLFRIALPWPPKKDDGTAIKPEFRIEVVSDPTGCNTSATYGLKSANPSVSVFRRPRVAANLKYVVEGPAGLTFMADGREPALRTQAINAAMTHEAAPKPTEQQLREIVEFESQIYLAQGTDIRAGLLHDVNGPLPLGPENLLAGKAQPMQATAGGREKNPTWLSFDTWRKADVAGMQGEFRASVARGSDVFFGHQFRISAVSGSTGGQATCASCHSPQAHRWMDIGTSNVKPETASADLPVFRITCDASAAPHPFGRIIYTQDPGRALISGKCADVGAFMMPQFHGLAARAPYFANGSAATLDQVLDFYERRFSLGLTEQEKTDLVNFLRVL
jgi:hypothetical protein